LKRRVRKIHPLRVKAMALNRLDPEVINWRTHEHPPENRPNKESSHNGNYNPADLEETLLWK
jgi:hypothetical protein